MSKEEFFEQFDDYILSPVFKKLMEMVWNDIKDLLPEEQDQYVSEMRDEADRELERRIAKLN